MNGNLQARTRMAVLYAQANLLDGLVIGTGNKTELLLGYFTKHGDSGADLQPLGNTYKTQVIAIAKKINIPEAIINRKPSANLYENQTDEAELGISYEVADKILQAFENKYYSCHAC